ncbi:DUF2442 domain-containing protein [Caldilinea sp.]|uniref:DUF2442 domain-containing protein n=1 Tax=Caldilinea sp. TaxID=2293560 RepID=UPI003136ED01|nr:DUF2442 domain-containing protein [Anaerolineales bacterium]
MDRLLHSSSSGVVRGYHATDPLTWPPDVVVAIVNAELISSYTLRLYFEDGFTRDVDFEPFLTQAVHPQIRQFLAPERFQTFRVESGDLVWGDYDLCFAVADLYTGKL